MLHLLRFAALAGLLLVVACDSAPTVAPASAEVDVLTQAFTRGAELGPLADGAPGAFAVYSAVDGSRLALRAGALARHILAVGAPIVGLQDLLTVRTQYPANGELDADRVRVDALALLLDSLAAQGASYRVASRADIWDVELPAGRADGPRFDLRLTESTAVLVADSLSASAGPSLRFDGEPLGAGALTAPAGASTARVLVGDAALVVASVRLSSDPRAARDHVAELRAALTGGLPVVLLGGPATGEAPVLDGLADAWRTLRPAEDGFTCCAPDAWAPVPFELRSDAAWAGDGARPVAVELAIPEPPPTAGTPWTSGRAGLRARLRIGPRL